MSDHTIVIILVVKIFLAAWGGLTIDMNKVSGGDGIPVELFQILEDGAVKVLHSICQQIWKTQHWPQDSKRSVFIPIPKNGNLISGSSAFSKTSLNIWKFMVHILLKPGLENFEHYFTSM